MQKAPPKVRAFALGSVDLAALLDDGRMVATTHGRMRAVDVGGDVHSFRSDGAGRYTWLQNGRPHLWLSYTQRPPFPVCGIEGARDVISETGRLCVVTANGSLGCTEASERPPCSPLEKPAIAGPFQAFLQSREGTSGLIDAKGVLFELTFPRDKARATVHPGSFVASELLGVRMHFTVRGAGSCSADVVETCAQSKGVHVCFDRKTGKSRPISELPANATKPGFVGKNALCYLRNARVECQSLAPGIDEHRPPSAFVGRRFESLPELPTKSPVVEWSSYGESIAVLTAAGELFSWRVPDLGDPPETWTSFDLDPP